MAVSNSIAMRTNNADAKVVEYQVNGASVRLTPNMVKAYLTNGDGRVTDQEVAMFINLCKYQELNPLVKDAYLIKYGNQPATIVTSKDAIMKRAMRNPRYVGHQAGVIVLNPRTGELEYRTGALVLKEEELVGGWAKTFVEGYNVPIETTVGFEEYAGRKKNGELNSMWAKMAGVMIRKVALVASLREAFPEQLQGMYASEEMNTDIDDTMVTVDIPEDEIPQPVPEPQQVEVVTIPEPELQQDLPPWETQQSSMDELEGVF